MEFFAFPALCTKTFLDSVVALMEAWKELFSALLFPLLLQR